MTTIVKFNFMQSKGTKSFKNRKKQKNKTKTKTKLKNPGGIYVRINDRARSLLSFHLPVVDFRVLLGSSSKKHTGSFTTY